MERAKVLPLLHFLVPILACYCVGICMAIDNITITQPLRDPGNIFSSSQTFKLGFFSPQNTSNRYVGIMYNIPLMTVVWVANRDKPLNDSAGTLTISGDGNLVVLNGKNETLWSTNISDSARTRTAQLLDTGNLVLKDSSSGMTVWESFQFPTDSFLQKMKLGTTEKLTSWATSSNPSPGNFSVGLQTLPTAQIFIWNQNKVHWRSGPWGGNVFIGIQNMDSAYLNGYDLVDGGSESAYFTYTISNDWPPGHYFYNLTVTGVLMEQYWGEGSSSWQVTWLSMESQCDTYGKCGAFGSCNPQNTAICTCLKGFEPSDREEWDRGNWTHGCRRKTLLQCERSNSAGQDGFIKLQNMKVPDFAELKSASAQFCGELCLRNCSCSAYSYYTGIGCMHWSDSLVDIQQFSEGGADLYVRVVHSELGKTFLQHKSIIVPLFNFFRMTFSQPISVKSL